jgi:phosphoribosylformylglycinamidine synthase
MTACALDEAVRNAVAVGAKPGTLAGLDNFCWPDPVESENTPDGQYKLAQLVRSNQALYDYCVAYGLPLISGKDSMKNDFGRGKDKISVPPTLLFTVIGKLDDCEQAVTMDAKAAGDLVYVLGTTRNELGASEYYRIVGVTGANVPKVDAAPALALYRRLHAAITRGLVRSAHDCSDGGLFVALAEVGMAGRLGLRIDLASLPVEGPLSPVAKLFSESQSRFVVTVRPADKAAFEAALAGSAIARLGSVTEALSLEIADGSAHLFSAPLDVLFERWRRPLDW